MRVLSRLFGRRFLQGLQAAYDAGTLHLMGSLRALQELKLEFVNVVPFRVGEPFVHPALGRLDTRENILANKVSSIVDRHAPKDLADIYWLCCREGLSLVDAMNQPTGKAAGIFPPFVARALHEVLSHGIPNVAWILRPEEDEFRQGIESLIAQLLNGADEGPR